MAETGLTDGDFTERAEPFRLFSEWLDDATASEPNDPNAMALATVDPDGMREVDAWVEQFRAFWDQRLDALGTEVARGRKASGTQTNIGT